MVALVRSFFCYMKEEKKLIVNILFFFTLKWYWPWDNKNTLKKILLVTRLCREDEKKVVLWPWKQWEGDKMIISKVKRQTHVIKGVEDTK